MISAASVNLVLKVVKEMTDKDGEWVGNSPMAAVRAIDPSLSERTIGHALTTLVNLNVITKVRSRHSRGSSISRTHVLCFRITLLRPDVVIVKRRGYFEADEKR